MKASHGGSAMKKFLKSVAQAGLTVETKKSGTMMIKHWNGVDQYTYHPGNVGVMNAIQALNKWEGVDIPKIK